jgi:type II secretory pathway pseudopilin PulG
MNPKRKELLLIFGKNDQAGSVLVELIVAAIIFALVVASIAFYFVHHVGTMDNGRSQLKLQRVGSLLMEEMARALREGKTTDLPDDDTSYPNLMITYPDPNRAPECFVFDDINKDIKGGPDYNNLTPLEVLDDSHIVGSVNRTHRILCDKVPWEEGLFKKQGDRVTIRFKLIHDMETEDIEDDLDIWFFSTVKLRG